MAPEEDLAANIRIFNQDTVDTVIEDLKIPEDNVELIEAYINLIS